jgi:transposase
MMGRRNQSQGQLFYEFRLDDAVPDDHLVRKISALLDLSWVYAELAPYYSEIGRPSIDPVLMIRMLIIGYVFAIRSERQICREVQVNLAYRWFCELGLEDAIPDHSAFSRARNERFRESEVFRRVFERVAGACIEAGLVGGEGFAVDASLIEADANRQRSIPGVEWKKQIDSRTSSSIGLPAGNLMSVKIVQSEFIQQRFLNDFMGKQKWFDAHRFCEPSQSCGASGGR